jgi:hypothetical protein
MTIVLLAAALVIGIGTYAMTWFTQKSGPNTIKLRPGEITVCRGETCTTQESDSADYDSTWLGITNACKVAGGLGILACGAGAALTQGRKTQFGTGGTAIKKNHVLFAALIGLGLTAASLLMVPIGLEKATGIFVALAGYAVGAAGIFLLKDEPEPRPAPRPMS